MSHCDMERGWKRECAASTQSHMVISTYLVDERCWDLSAETSVVYVVVECTFAIDLAWVRFPADALPHGAWCRCQRHTGS